MPRYDHECLVCGTVAEVVCAPEESPACVCGGDTVRVWIGSGAVHGDDIEGGMWVENGFPEPIKVFSHSEHRRLLAERGLEIRAKWAGDNDRHLSRWDAPSQTTLDNAAILLTRGAQAVREKNERWKDATMPITVTVLETGVKRSDLD